MITSDKIDRVREKIKKAIEKIELEEKVSINFGAATYNSAYFKSTMTVRTLEKTQASDDVYKRLCFRLGFTQNIIGMKFHGKNGIYEIVDVVTKNRKYPVIAKNPDGKQFKYTVVQIKSLIGGDKIINRNANLDKLVG